MTVLMMNMHSSCKYKVGITIYLEITFLLSTRNFTTYPPIIGLHQAVQLNQYRISEETPRLPRLSLSQIFKKYWSKESGGGQPTEGRTTIPYALRCWEKIRKLFKKSKTLIKRVANKW